MEIGVAFFLHHWGLHSVALGRGFRVQTVWAFCFCMGSREVGPVGFIKLHASPGLGWHAGALLFKEEYVLVVSKVSCSVGC